MVMFLEYIRTYYYNVTYTFLRQVQTGTDTGLGFRLQVQNSGFRGINTFSFFQNQVKLWLNTALKKEEESWLGGSNPELIDQYCFSPLGIDVIQVRHSQYRWDTVSRPPSDTQSFILYSWQEFCIKHYKAPVKPIKPTVVWQVYLDLEPFEPLCVQGDGYMVDLCFQVMDTSLTEFGCVIRDQNKAQRITAHLESFLAR